jgi:hypothetical protein
MVMKDRGMSKVNVDGARDVLRRAAAGETNSSIAKSCGIHQNQVSDIVRGVAFPLLKRRGPIVREYRQPPHPVGGEHYNARLTEASVAEIRSLRGKVTQKNLAIRFGVGGSQIQRIMTRKAWRHVP